MLRVTAVVAATPGKRAAEEPMSRLLISTAAAILLQGCTQQHEHRIRLAQCSGGGDLYVLERVEARTGLAGRSLSNTFDLYYMDPSNNQIPIQTSSLGRPAMAGDRLNSYATPRQNDWHLYISPSALDAHAYDTLAACIGTSRAEIDARMSVQRAPYPFLAQERRLPRISTIRYADLNELRRQFECEPGRIVQSQEDGRVYFKSDVTVLLGKVTEGNRIELEEGALRYLKIREGRSIPEPVGYLDRCRDSDGVSLFEAFHSSMACARGGS